MNHLDQLIEKYLSGVASLREAVKGMTRETLTARPFEGKWSTLEVVCHLADFDPILADRMKRIIAEDQPALLSADEKCFATCLAYHERDLEEEMGIIENTRRQMVRILQTLPPEAFQRGGVHNLRGPLTLEKLLEMAGNHIAHHVQFILEKRWALGLPA